MKKPLSAALIALLSAAALLLLTSMLLAGTRQNAADMALQHTLTTLLPGSSVFSEETPAADHPLITAAWRSSHGCVAEVTCAGYAGDIVMLVGVDNGGTVTGVVLRDLQETYGLGFRALNHVPFLSQLPGTAGNARLGDNVQPITGATVTSRAVVRAVNAASAYVTGADTTTEATEWEALT